MFLSLCAVYLNPRYLLWLVLNVEVASLPFTLLRARLRRRFFLEEHISTTNTQNGKAFLLLCVCVSRLLPFHCCRPTMTGKQILTTWYVILEFVLNVYTLLERPFRARAPHCRNKDRYRSAKAVLSGEGDARRHPPKGTSSTSDHRSQGIRVRF